MPLPRVVLGTTIVLISLLLTACGPRATERPPSPNQIATQVDTAEVNLLMDPEVILVTAKPPQIPIEPIMVAGRLRKLDCVNASLPSRSRDSLLVKPEHDARDLRLGMHSLHIPAGTVTNPAGIWFHLEVLRVGTRFIHVQATSDPAIPPGKSVKLNISYYGCSPLAAGKNVWIVRLDHSRLGEALPATIDSANQIASVQLDRLSGFAVAN
jgi:hypothetical protein